MAIRTDKNERIVITLSKKQVKWLRKSAKALKITVSRMVAFLIDKNVANILNRSFNEEELKELIRIAKINWLDE